MIDLNCISSYICLWYFSAPIWEAFQQHWHFPALAHRYKILLNPCMYSFGCIVESVSDSNNCYQTPLKFCFYKVSGLLSVFFFKKDSWGKFLGQAKTKTWTLIKYEGHGNYYRDRWGQGQVIFQNGGKTEENHVINLKEAWKWILETWWLKKMGGSKQIPD